MTRESPPILLPYATPRPAPRRRIALLPHALNGLAVAALVFDFVRPRFSFGPPPSLPTYMFSHSTIWLACLLSLVSVLLTGLSSPRSWAAFTCGLAILICTIAALDNMTIRHQQDVAAYQRLLTIQPSPSPATPVHRSNPVPARPSVTLASERPPHRGQK